MALVIDSDPFSVSANSYVSLAEILTYITDRVPDEAVLTAWSLLTTAQKSTYLVNATRMLDSSCQWLGAKYSRDQKLDWPRVDVYVETYSLDVTIVPEAIKDATCEMAIWSMQHNGLIAEGQNAEFKQIKVGPINVEFNSNVSGSKDKYFPDVVAMILAEYGTMVNPDLPGAKHLKTVKLYRA